MAQPVANASSYAVLWGTQLAMTVALAGAMAGLSWRLRQPLMRALALHWVARLAIVGINLLYYVCADPAALYLAPFALLFGTACGGLLLSAQWSVRDATPDAPPAHALRPIPTLVVFTLLAGVAHAYNIGTPPFSPGWAAVWTRSLFTATYLAFAVWLALRWLDHPSARHRIAPLLIGVVISMAFDLFDAVQRSIVLSGGAPFGSHILTIVGSLTGTLCLGVGSLLSALESERDTLKRQGEQLRVAQQEQSEAQRLQSLGHLARGVAHDFNNVLGLLLNGIEFVQAAVPPDHADAHRDLREMRSAVDRGTSLTRRLLDFARPQQANSPVDPAVVLSECLPMLRRLLSSRISLRASVTGSAAVEMDRSQFEQMLINLLVNARDATPGEGTVRLSLGLEETHVERAASVGRLGVGRWVRLTVIDDGAGIAGDVMPSLFEPFFTTKGEKGTGLGLATVSSAVRDAKGAIDVFSTPGRGARFDVWLPALHNRSGISQSGKSLQMVG